MVKYIMVVEHSPRPNTVPKDAEFNVNPFSTGEWDAIDLFLRPQLPQPSVEIAAPAIQPANITEIVRQQKAAAMLQSTIEHNPHMARYPYFLLVSSKDGDPLRVAPQPFADAEAQNVAESNNERKAKMGENTLLLVREITGQRVLWENGVKQSMKR